MLFQPGILTQRLPLLKRFQNFAISAQFSIKGDGIEFFTGKSGTKATVFNGFFYSTGTNGAFIGRCSLLTAWTAFG